jgi:hypothetical protein
LIGVVDYDIQSSVAIQVTDSQPAPAPGSRQATARRSTDALKFAVPQIPEE